MAKTNKPSATKAPPRKKTRPASQGTSRASGKKKKTSARNPATHGGGRQSKATEKRTVKKAAVKKAAAKKTAAKKTAVKKVVVRKTAVKKATLKKAVKKKAPAPKARATQGKAKAAGVAKVPVKQAAARKAPEGNKVSVKGKPATTHGKQQPTARPETSAKAAAPAMATATPKPHQAPARKPQKQAYQLEFYLKASQASLYELISTPSGFSEWFCDDVDVADNMYTFKWGDESETAECIAQRFGQYTRFRWVEDQEDDPFAFFELRIRIDSMTNETCLVVTDHAWPKDIEEERALWESQVQTLIRVLGA